MVIFDNKHTLLLIYKRISRWIPSK